MPSVVFLTTDLMFSSRLLGAAATLGLKLHLVSKAADVPARLSDDCRLVLVDLSVFAADLVEVVIAARGHAPQAQVIAYGPHVDEVLLAAARDAGCHQVLSRGQFHQQYLELLRSAAA